MGVEFTQSARRHKIGKARVRQVLANPVVVDRIVEEHDPRVRLLILGDDDTGRALEVIAVQEDEVFVLIHRDGSAAEVQGTVRGGGEAMTARKAKETVTLKDGTVLDDEAADRIVAEVEEAVLAGRGSSSFPRKGRPSLTGRAAASPHVGFRVSPEARDEAEAIARERGVTVSALAREALE